MYIAEEKNDWNDLHPWIEGNEWNRVLSEGDYDDFATQKLITTLSVGNGGQVIHIPNYSPIRTGGDDEGKVAYDYPEGDFKGYDSPFDFAYKLLRQRENINHYYTNGDHDDPVTLDSGDALTLSALQNWSKTEAPSDKWKNYRGTSSGEYEPFLPGLGLYWHQPHHGTLVEELKGKYDTFIAENPNALSAGVDCIGFTKRSASYGDTYKWGKIEGNITEGASADTRVGNNYPSQVSGAIENVADEDSTEYIEVNGLEKEVISNLDKLVPGDIVYYGTDHIMIIQKITFNGSGRRVEMKDVTLAESTSGNYGDDGGGIIYYCTNLRNIQNLANIDKPWIIGRLK